MYDNNATTRHKPHYVDWELPNGWEWCRIDDFAYVAAGSTPSKESFVNKGIPYIKMYNLRGQRIDFEYRPQYIKEEVHNGKLMRSRTEVGDLIMNIVGPPLGKLAIIPSSLPHANFNQAAVLIRPLAFKDVLVKYLFYYLSQMSEINSIATRGSAGQVNISLTQSQNMRIALPPLNEQKRIVNQIELLWKYLDLADEETNNLKEASEKAKSKILGLAISGKLVAQDPVDEPAEVLLKRVNPNAVVSADTSHYGQLPNGWCYTTMNYVCQLYDGEKIDGKAFINLDAKYLRGKSEGNILNSGRYVPAKTTMILVDGENSGEIFTAPINGYQGSTFKLLNINGEMNVEYVKMIIRIYQKRLRDNKVGSAIPHLNKKMFREILVPVPPIAEQVRIVDYTNELLSKINILTETL